MFFVVRTCIAHKDTELGAGWVSEASGKIICDKPSTLLIHEHPLPAYLVWNQLFVVLKYAPFDMLWQINLFGEAVQISASGEQGAPYLLSLPWRYIIVSYGMENVLGMCHLIYM